MILTEEERDKLNKFLTIVKKVDNDPKSREQIESAIRKQNAIDKRY